MSLAMRPNEYDNKVQCGCKVKHQAATFYFGGMEYEKEFDRDRIYP